MNQVTERRDHLLLTQPAPSCCSPETVLKIGGAALGLIGLGSGCAFYLLQMPTLVAYATGGFGGGTLLATTLWSVIDSLNPCKKSDGTEQLVGKTEITLYIDHFNTKKVISKGELKFLMHENPNLQTITVEVIGSIGGKEKQPDLSLFDDDFICEEPVDSDDFLTQPPRHITRYTFVKRHNDVKAPFLI